VAQHDRIQPTDNGLTPYKPPQTARPENTGKAGQTSGYPTPTQEIKTKNRPRRNTANHRWIEAKSHYGGKAVGKRCRGRFTHGEGIVVKAIMVAVTGLVVCVHKLTTRGSDTSSLERGDCVKVNGVGSTFSGNVENVSCSKVEPLSDYYPRSLWGLSRIWTAAAGCAISRLPTKATLRASHNSPAGE
jgi:hypothetical protein